MGKSGNPATAAAAMEEAKLAASSASSFKKARKGRLLTLPSGLIAKVKRVELQTYILKNDVPNPLMAIIHEAISKGKGIDMEKALGVDKGELDLEKLAEMYEIVDNLMVAMFVEPKVEPAPEDEKDRDDDVVYPDDIDEEDKMFLFQWSMGGTEDIATFRLEAQQGMAAVAKKPGSKSTTKRTSRASS